jgi:glycosyltransferase involved in cell wall biosynthesis
MLSVIIPAHNEEAVIAATLRNLVDAVAPGELEVIVVPNGCTDRTADVARTVGGPIIVHEIPTPSKVAALNAGDRIARSYPRFYLDADVLLSFAALRALAERLDKADVSAVAPRARVDTNACSWPVRAFYTIHALLPSSREGIGGSGVYGLSEQGRARFTEFPAVLADDTFVRIHFFPHERETLASVTSTVFAPRRLSELITIKTRSHLGNAQLADKYPNLWHNKGEANWRELITLLKNWRLWPSLLIYCCTKLEIRRRATAQRKRLRTGDVAWARDQSSRQRTAPN